MERSARAPKGEGRREGERSDGDDADASSLPDDDDLGQHEIDS